MKIAKLSGGRSEFDDCKLTYQAWATCKLGQLTTVYNELSIKYSGEIATQPCVVPFLFHFLPLDVQVK